MFTRFKPFKILLAYGLMILLSGTVSAQENREWKTFTPDAGDWSILAPGVMRSDPNGIEQLDKKGGYSYTDETGFFAVVYEDSPGWVVTMYKPFIGSHYKKIRKKFVKDSNGKLLKDEKFNNGAERGREFLVQIPDGKVLDGEGQWKPRYKIARFRVFLHGKRSFILMAVVPENEVYTSSINNYFTSFSAKN